MQILIGTSLTLAFLLALAAPGTGDFYVAVLDTPNEVPDPWEVEKGLYTAAAALVLAAAALTWVRDRARVWRGEQTFYPRSWLFL